MEAVAIVSEDDRQARSRLGPTHSALLAWHAHAGTFREETTERPWKERSLGSRPRRMIARLDVPARNPFVALPEDI